MVSLLLTSFLFFVAVFVVGASERSVVISKEVNWTERCDFSSLPFQDEGHMEGNLPVLRFRVPLQDGALSGSLNVEVHDVVWAPGCGIFIDEINNAGWDKRYNLVFIRSKVYAEVELVPLRVEAGQVSRMENFTVTVKYQVAAGSEIKSSSTQTNFPSESVLATGHWQKISVNQTGVHRIPYATLASWGFSDPSKVSIFGFGGQMVPRLNSAYRPADLPRVATWHHGNALFFFANGPVNWSWDNGLNMFVHTLHYFSDKSFYFLTDKELPPANVNLREVESRTPSHIVTRFDDRDYHERELVNLINSGREWFGESFSVTDRLERNFAFSFPNRDVTLPVKIRTGVVSRSATASTFSYFVNNSTTANISLTLPSSSLHGIDGFYAHWQSASGQIFSPQQNIDIRVRYNDQAQTSTGRLDFITINARSHLQMNGDQLLFRDRESSGQGNIARFIINNATTAARVWDVTDIISPVEVVLERDGNRLEFVAEAAIAREYVVFNPAGQLPVPERVGVVSNQNLHGLAGIDYVIVAYPGFLQQANKLANLHQIHHGLSTIVVTPEQVFNEFSWGHRDPTAIRSLMRMLYERAGNNRSEAPRYLLLFGNGSYDNRSDNPLTRSLIITYQSDNSIHRTNTYVTDDYFGFLDPAEGANIISDRLDIGIGRFPVRSVEDATVAVNKVEAYLEAQDRGSWRQIITLAADDGDFNIHQRDADFLAQRIENINPEFIVRKLYIDNFRKITTSTGKMAVGLQDAVNRAINEGTLIFNYVGHGSQRALAEENMVTLNSIAGWRNIRRLPLFVTATCEFSRFDDPLVVSAGERVFLSPQGGAIALLSTTRVVFSSLNFQLNSAFINNVFRREPDGSKPTLGTILMNTKNSSGNTINKLNFTLLGDPALALNYPRNRVNLVSINNNPVGMVPDTLKALSRVKLRGEVTDESGVRFSGFNGEVEITVFDKPLQIRTLGNDGATPFQFQQFVNILFRGKAIVSNGEFDVEFIVPLDTRYNFDRGKISFFAHSPNHGEAFGAFTDVIIGGFDTNAPVDNEGPMVNMFLNHESFTPGDKVGAEPLLYVNIIDQSGINTSGAGIGHNIILVLNGNSDEPVILNSFFRAKPDTFQEGNIIFQLPALPAGKHQLTLRVWDTYNNSTTVETTFEVVNREELKIEDFTWFPNPIGVNGTGYFSFRVEEPDAILTITVDAISPSGAVAGRKVINTMAVFNQVEPMPVSLPQIGIISSGLHFMRFHVKSSSGLETSVVEKLLITP